MCRYTPSTHGCCHCRGSTLHGLEEWSISTGLFTKSKDWHAIHSKWSDRSVKAFIPVRTCTALVPVSLLGLLFGPSAETNEAASGSALVLHSHHSHSELRKIAGLGHEVKPQPNRRVWLPAAERRRYKLQEPSKSPPQIQQHTPQTSPPLLPEPWQQHIPPQKDIVDSRSNAVEQSYHRCNSTTGESRRSRPYSCGPEDSHLLGANLQFQFQTTAGVQQADHVCVPEVAASASICQCAEVTSMGSEQPQLTQPKQRQQSLDDLLPDYAVRCVFCASALLLVFMHTKVRSTPVPLSMRGQYVCLVPRITSCMPLCRARELEKAARADAFEGQNSPEQTSPAVCTDRNKLKQQKLTDLVASMQACAAHAPEAV